MKTSTDFKEIEYNKDLLFEGVTEMAEAVGSTMGPYGKTIIIKDETGTPKITKDGVSVAKSVYFHNPIKYTGAILAKQAAMKTVEEAGDGTTATTVILNKLINNKTLQELDEKTRLKYFNEIEETVYKYLNKIATKVNHYDSDLIENLAAVSSNDSYIGKLISVAFKPTDNVVVKKTDKTQDSVKTVNGMNIPTGIFDNAFINDPKTQSVVYDKCHFILINEHVDNLKKYADFLEKITEDNPLPVIIMAEHFSDSVINQLRSVYNSGTLKLALIKTPGYAEHRQNLIKDFSKTIAPEVNPFLKAVHYGVINSIVASKKEVVIQYDRDTSADNYLKELKKIEETGYTKELLQRRIQMLESSLSVIEVGADTVVELDEKYDRIEDAVLAVKCAIEEGYVAGRGSALQLYVQKFGNSNPVASSLLAPTTWIYNNAGESIEYKNSEELLQEGIIDPVKVIKTAVKNAFSVAKTMLNTKAIIV